MKRFALAVAVLFALGAGTQASAEDEPTGAVSQDTAATSDSPAMATDTSTDPAASEPGADPAPAASDDDSNK